MTVTTAPERQLTARVHQPVGRRNRAVTLAFVVALVIYTFVLLARPFGQDFSRAVGLLGKSFITLLIGLWCACDGVFRRDNVPLSWQNRRSIPIIFGLVLVFTAIGDAFLSYRVLVIHNTARSTSIADYIYIAVYPLLIAGLLKMPVRPIPFGDRIQTVLDGLIAMTSLVTFSWFFFLSSVFESGAHTLYDRVMAAASPCCDLLVMFCILVVSFHPSERRRNGPVALAFCAISLSLIGDGLYLYLVAHSASGINGILTPIWLTGYLLLALSGIGASRVPTAETPHPDRTGDLPARLLEGHSRLPWRSIAPYALVPPLLALIAFVLLHPEIHRSLANGVFAGGGALILLIMTRQMMVLMDHSRHSRLLRAAYKELRSTQGALAAQADLLAETNEQLRMLATTDTLTGLANRRAFQDRIAEEARIAQAGSTACGLMLLDVDNFKAYNDTYGHPAGDEILKIVARLIRDSIPANGLAARYGGEEFAVLLPGASCAQSRASAEAVRLRIEEHEFPGRAITVSIGVACLPIGSGSEVSQVAPHAISTADTALYRAKHAGRNRVEHWDEQLDLVAAEEK